MKRQRIAIGFINTIIFMTFTCLAVASISFAADEKRKKKLPPRKISVSSEYTGVILPAGENVNVDLSVDNMGRRDENIELTVTEKPEGWKAWIKTYSFDITGVHVKSDDSKSVTFRAEPGPDVAPGDYRFAIQAKTEDGRLRSTSRLKVVLKEEKKKKKTTGINIITSYPVLKGPTDAKFEFSLEVENKLEKDGIFNLSAQGPENWEINFKPAYEQKFISSLRLKQGQSQTMAVEVKPNMWERPGEYPIKIKVSSAEAEGEADLVLLLTGSYKLDAGTANGLLSLNAVRGEQANVSLYIKNSGSAPMSNVRFLSFKPENWKVEFEPEKIDMLPAGEMKQIEVSITSADQALVGDYSVGLNFEAGKASKLIELRVTVKASSAWGWIGIGMIVLVIGCLVFLFIRLGRR